MAAAKANGHALAVTAPDPTASSRFRTDQQSASTTRAAVPDAVAAGALPDQQRRATRGLKDNYKPLGYPSLAFVDATDPFDGAVAAVTEIAKYGGTCVPPTFDAAAECADDPAAEPVYRPRSRSRSNRNSMPGEPRHFPVFVTTNFSLTYFIVSGELEKQSGWSAWCCR